MNEEILGIIDVVDYSGRFKKGTRLALTTDRLIVARGGVLETLDLSAAIAGDLIVGGAMAAIGAALRGRKEKKEKEKVFAELTPDGILSAGKENVAISWSAMTRVEVGEESWLRGVQGKRFKVFTADKKYEFGETKGRMMGEFWHVLNVTIPDKVTLPKDREKFDREISKLENTPVDVLCAHLRSIGFEAEIWGLEEEAKKLTAYFDAGVAEIKGRNIDYIGYQRQWRNWGIDCILQNVTAKWKSTETKKRGQQDFEWVGDEKISDALNQDISVKNALLEEMQAKEIDNVYITEPEDNEATIRVWPKERLPSKRLLEAEDKIAGYLRKIA